MNRIRRSPWVHSSFVGPKVYTKICGSLSFKNIRFYFTNFTSPKRKHILCEHIASLGRVYECRGAEV